MSHHQPIVLLVTRCPLWREGLRQLLKPRFPGLLLLAVQRIDEALNLAVGREIHLLLIDLHLLTLPVERLRTLLPGTPPALLFCQSPPEKTDALADLLGEQTRLPWDLAGKVIAAHVLRHLPDGA